MILHNTVVLLEIKALNRKVKSLLHTDGTGPIALYNQKSTFRRVIEVSYTLQSIFNNVIYIHDYHNFSKKINRFTYFTLLNLLGIEIILSCTYFILISSFSTLKLLRICHFYFQILSHCMPIIYGQKKLELSFFLS